MNKIAKYLTVFSLASTMTLSTTVTADANTTTATKQSEVKQQASTEQQVNLGAENIMAVSWYQNSAEAKALYLQGYNTAKTNLDQELKKHKKNNGHKKLAIALDIDETVLDNSPYQGYSALHNKSYPEGWHEWIQAAKAKPVYGAKDFLQYADKKGVDIYYISDRDKDKDFKATKENLIAQGLPQATDQHIMLKGKNDKNKAERRDKVRKNHKLVMLFGDNLLDFDDPQQPTQASREQLVNKHQKDFGKKYIIFPNPMYGSWESVLYNNDFSQSDAKKDQLRKQSIQYFDPETSAIKQGQTTNSN
ncbi:MULTISPECIES: 5'-nucleotidase, lipoprotein e(P4) family [Staphylococcus]|uniref:5'-nucleotidase, lipoprotein e(P4) family n=1 Tax=Staphylococcus gallinarum TaxID=1293 RepID=A0A418HLI7_STAGA|nr:5'-nucleotidase, lipoprotein e(P4) family [Staphylococcus gallinarum]KIR12298.1 5'-nucleotidase [Staphylococcus gallinarum]MBU7218139.1 5'-nucleotidase, lipoprotein e(P4) family [Staphylococcus gallinarum]MCD8787124.1 5'-nucleotidase, lipoprotein e(P4) family [Staphylococcus gallinarum]MCD8794644.1 5'-nucleotidase, lipoprotein e(P4) family [Staphylococcus gallinarum]MCD8827202.1 5'-nucleotidase, lipoprotein e(P4) family [Staphylococcus gallinarum]